MVIGSGGVLTIYLQIISSFERGEDQVYWASSNKGIFMVNRPTMLFLRPSTVRKIRFGVLRGVGRVPKAFVFSGGSSSSSSSSSSSEVSATDDFDREARSCSMALKYSSSVLAPANSDWALDFWVKKVCWALECVMVG